MEKRIELVLFVLGLAINIVTDLRLKDIDNAHVNNQCFRIIDLCCGQQNYIWIDTYVLRVLKRYIG